MMQGGLAMEVRVEGASTVIAIAGEIDLATIPLLTERLDQLIGEGRIHLVLDMSDVIFVDSTGLSALIRVRSRVLAEGGSIDLAGAQANVAKVFEITNLTEVFSLHDSVAQAFAANVGPKPEIGHS